MARHFLAASLLLFLATAAYAVDIDACGYLNDANSVYTLTGDINEDLAYAAKCIVFNNTNITLDCAGHGITSNLTSQTIGIYVNKDSATIRNCNINRNATNGFHWAIYGWGDNLAMDNMTIASSDGLGWSYTAGGDGGSITNSVLFCDGYRAFRFTGTAGGFLIENVSTNSISFETGTGYTLRNITLLSTGTSYRGILILAASQITIQGIRGDSYNTNAFQFSVANTEVDCEGETITGNAGAASIGLLFSGAAANNITVKNCILENFRYPINIENGAYGETIINCTLNASGTSERAIFLETSTGSANNSIFINNTIIAAGADATGIYADINASGNTFYWNNFTDTSGIYVNDTNGSNFYNSTEGNIYHNVINGSVVIYGLTPSTGFPSLNAGQAGAGYPYNSTNSLGKMIGATDYRPLTTLAAPPTYANLTVLCNGGAETSCTGNATNFETPANKSINASGNANWTFANWAVTSGSCTILNSTDNETEAIFAYGDDNCIVTANFTYNCVLSSMAYAWNMTPDGTIIHRSTNPSWLLHIISYTVNNEAYCPVKVRAQVFAKNGTLLSSLEGTSLHSLNTTGIPTDLDIYVNASANITGGTNQWTETRNYYMILDAATEDQKLNGQVQAGIFILAGLLLVITGLGVRE